MKLKGKLKNIIKDAAKKACEKKILSNPDFPDPEIEEPRAETHGDFSTNIAMKSASIQKMAPVKIARAILDNLEDKEGIIEKTDIAGPGFINFYLNPSAWHPVLYDIHKTDENYGAVNIGNGMKVQVEFVSANPTGPLHVGHGRGAAVGDAVAAILSFCGYNVQKEYYINDSGRQIRTLGLSVFMRYKELLGHKIDFPEDCYKGDYIKELAAIIKDNKGKSLFETDEDKAILYCARFAAENILSGIKKDLDDFGVKFDNWFSEQSLYDSEKVEKCIKNFREKGLIYEKDGALWFKTSDFGDEKDRVVVRANGLTTYFASDIAYHIDKYQRGIQWVIDVWGADHHGYIPRMSAAIQASGNKKEQFGVILVQLVNLLRGGMPVAMSSRAGEFVTLKEVVDEVGKDAARFIFLTRHWESKLDFDLELAKKKTNDNPVYYVQYVHARISSIMAKARERGIKTDFDDPQIILPLKEPEEIRLIKILDRYPDVVKASARMLEPHRITYYLLDLASAFHAYYNKHRVLTDDIKLTFARLYLALAVKKIIRNGLKLLGVSRPEKM